jgi:hypothetical protein
MRLPILPGGFTVGAGLENTEYGMDKNLFLEYCLPFKGYPFHRFKV